MQSAVSLGGQDCAGLVEHPGAGINADDACARKTAAAFDETASVTFAHQENVSGDGDVIRNAVRQR